MYASSPVPICVWMVIVVLQPDSLIGYVLDMTHERVSSSEQFSSKIVREQPKRCGCAKELRKCRSWIAVQKGSLKGPVSSINSSIEGHQKWDAWTRPPWCKVLNVWELWPGETCGFPIIGNKGESGVEREVCVQTCELRQSVVPNKGCNFNIGGRWS